MHKVDFLIDEALARVSKATLYKLLLFNRNENNQKDEF